MNLKRSSQQAEEKKHKVHKDEIEKIRTNEKQEGV
jgi:hypothetical protein